MTDKDKTIAAGTAAEDQFLSVDEILAADDMEYIDVEMPEWKKADGSPGVVRLRRFTNDELMEFGERIEGKDKRKANMIMVIMSAVTPGGSPLLTFKQLHQMQMKSAKAFNRLAKAALKLNGVGEEEVEKTKNG